MPCQVTMYLGKRRLAINKGSLNYDMTTAEVKRSAASFL